MYDEEEDDDHDDEGRPGRGADRVAETLAHVHRLAPVAAPAGARPRPGLHKPREISTALPREPATKSQRTCRKSSLSRNPCELVAALSGGLNR